MQISAKADYALRALVELAAGGGGPLKGDAIAGAQGIPVRFLESILAQLRQRGLLLSRRGSEGGYWLARPADQITLADIIRATDGPLAVVRGVRPDMVTYRGAAEPLGDVWIAVRSALRSVLEQVTVADVAKGELPDVVTALAAEPEARIAH